MPLFAFFAFELAGVALYVRILKAARRAFGVRSSSVGIAITSLRLAAERTRARNWGSFNASYRQSGQYYDDGLRELYKGNNPLFVHLTWASALFMSGAVIVLLVIVDASTSTNVEMIARDNTSSDGFATAFWGLAFLSLLEFVVLVALLRKVEHDVTMYKDCTVEEKAAAYRDMQASLDPEQYPRKSANRSARDFSRGRMTREMSPNEFMETEDMSNDPSDPKNEVGEKQTVAKALWDDEVFSDRFESWNVALAEHIRERTREHKKVHPEFFESGKD
jgi:hypothetical protein